MFDHRVTTSLLTWQVKALQFLEAKMRRLRALRKFRRVGSIASLVSDGHSSP
jgi:hypothetical protein